MRQLVEIERNFHRELNNECVNDLIKIVKDNGGSIEIDPDDNFIHVSNCADENWCIAVYELTYDEKAGLLFWGKYEHEHENDYEDEDELDSFSLNMIDDMSDVYLIHDNLI